ncbi:hypothetical protein KR026_001546 [Drosophila bipectinata]|nr:hypothetical protein KR026_001546 [Drosophila bipectinata]
MVTTPNKQVTSKFQSAHERPASCQKKSSNDIKPVPTIPLTPVKPTQISPGMRCLWQRGKANQLAKIAPASPPAPPALPAPNQIEKMPEKPPTGEQDATPVTPTKLEKEKPVPKSKTYVARPPFRTRIPRNAAGDTVGSAHRLQGVVVVDNSRRLMFPPPGRNPYAVTSRIYRPSTSGVFDYDLSQVEKRGFGHCSVDPMKSVPATELQLLHSGQRSTYLERRYERSPDDKYNYPEATSWRYGWFHRQSDPFQKRVPRRD